MGVGQGTCIFFLSWNFAIIRKCCIIRKSSPRLYFFVVSYSKALLNMGSFAFWSMHGRRLLYDPNEYPGTVWTDYMFSVLFSWDRSTVSYPFFPSSRNLKLIFMALENSIIFVPTNRTSFEMLNQLY